MIRAQHLDTSEAGRIAEHACLSGRRPQFWHSELSKTIPARSFCNKLVGVCKCARSEEGRGGEIYQQKGLALLAKEDAMQS